MMSINTRRLQLLLQNTSRLLHSSRVSQTKHYNYDLNSLIEWKKETAQAFGAVRKPTKTGKLTKLRKGLDPQVEENLQILSALSVREESSLATLSHAQVKKGNSKLKNCKVDIIVAHGQDNSSRLVQDVENYTEDCVLDIPDDVLISSLAPYVEESILKQSNDDKECVEFIYSGSASNNEIVIPKMSSIPISSSGTSSPKLNKSLSQVHAETRVTSRNVSKQAVTNSSVVVDTLNSEDSINVSTSSNNMPMKSKNYKNSNVTKRTPSETKEDINSAITKDIKSENKLKKKSTKNDIFIPVLKPIPSGTISYESLNSSSLQPDIFTVPSSQPTVTNPTLKLPFEPPESFEIITKIPLFPKESKEWQSKIDSQLLDSFKMDVEQMSLRAFPSVKSILNKTMPDQNRFFLNRWREGLIKELGEEGFKKHQDATIRNGVNLHANIMEILSGKSASELQIMPDNEGHWSSIQSALSAVSDVRALEMEVSHDMLLYRGVFDCLARYKDLLCMIDWKTSKKPRPLLKNTYDDPIQIAAYVGALNANDAYVKKYGQVNHGLIVVSYPDGSPAHIHVMNKSVCQEHWQDWTGRLYNYYQLIYTEKMAANAEKISAQKQMLSLGAA